MPRFTAIDLAGLRSPDVVVPPDYAALVAERKADIVARVRALGDDVLADTLAATLALEGELITKLVESGGYRQTLHYARVNDAARAVMLAFATGPDLEHLGVYYGVVRLAGEDDARLRRRIQLAPEALSTAGPIGAYVFHALSTSLDVLDAAVVKPSPGSVQVHIVARGGDGTPSAELLSLIAARFRDEDLVPFTDAVSVRAALFSDVAVTAHLRVGRGPDPATIVAAAKAGLSGYLAAQSKIGVELTTDGLIAAARVVGVRKAILLSPLQDVVPEAGGFVRVTGVTVTSEVME